MGADRDGARWQCAVRVEECRLRDGDTRRADVHSQAGSVVRRIEQIVAITEDPEAISSDERFVMIFLDELGLVQTLYMGESALREIGDWASIRSYG